MGEAGDRTAHCALRERPQARFGDPPLQVLLARLEGKDERPWSLPALNRDGLEVGGPEFTVPLVH